MKAPLLQIQIERDVMHKPVVRVFPHEIPVLQAKYGPESIYELKDSKKVTRDFDPSIQYAVLMRKYGADQGGTPWVATVYGQEFEGRLENAMQKGADLMKPKSEAKDVTPRKDTNS
jgi:hypothetical protein